MEHETKKKSEFRVNLLDHDVRNVFNNISSSIELCKIFLKDSHEMDKVSEQFNIMNAQIARGIILMSNVRKLYLFNETSGTTNPTDFYSILKEAINFIQKNFQDRENNINIESLDENGYVNADELILDIFENILINSILHNFNSVITILIKITETQKSNKKYIKFESGYIILKVAESKTTKIEIQKISDNFFVELANSTEFKRFIYKVLYGKVHRTEKQHGNLDEKVKVGLEVFQEFERGTTKNFKEFVKELKEKLAKQKVKVENESNNTVVNIWNDLFYKKI